eukprot:7210057-Lingulodinium_polyedra.AAC.1
MAPRPFSIAPPSPRTCPCAGATPPAATWLLPAWTRSSTRTAMPVASLRTTRAWPPRGARATWPTGGPDDLRRGCRRPAPLPKAV